MITNFNSFLAYYCNIIKSLLYFFHYPNYCSVSIFVLFEVIHVKLCSCVNCVKLVQAPRFSKTNLERKLSCKIFHGMKSVFDLARFVCNLQTLHSLHGYKDTLPF